MMLGVLMNAEVYARTTMHDNPPSSPIFLLPQHSVLALTGRDALPFAQAQFMNDVRTLDDGQWQWNGWLTPQGRLTALFALLRRDAETLWLLLCDTDPAALAAQLQRYVLRSKVTLAPLPLAVHGRLEAPLQAHRATFAHAADDALELDMSGDAGARTLLIGQHPLAQPDAGLQMQWRMSDLQHGLPWSATAQSGQWTPQQLSLQRLRAFSVNKGCYPGQEIVARTHFLGQAKRGLTLLQASAPIPVGTPLLNAGSPLGSVMDSVGTLALAVLPNAAPTLLETAAGDRLHQQPLANGLAR